MTELRFATRATTNYRRVGADLGGDSGADQMFCGENAKPLRARTEAFWVDRSIATMGAIEGTLHSASQPSIIMQPDSAMPMGPRRTHTTRTVTVATRQPLMTCYYPPGPSRSQLSGGQTLLRDFGGRALPFFS